MGAYSVAHGEKCHNVQYDSLRVFCDVVVFCSMLRSSHLHCTVSSSVVFILRSSYKKKRAKMTTTKKNETKNKHIFIFLVAFVLFHCDFFLSSGVCHVEVCSVWVDECEHMCVCLFVGIVTIICTAAHFVRVFFLQWFRMPKEMHKIAKYLCGSHSAGVEDKWIVSNSNSIDSALLLIVLFTCTRGEDKKAGTSWFLSLAYFVCCSLGFEFT